jgi:Insertion element 4 transposase N-terminal/Transposase DDE domain
MPRAGWVKPESDQRLSDHISIGVLTRTYPGTLVDRVLAGCGRVESRRRLLPARVMVYYAMALALFSESSYEEVMRNLVEGLDWSSGWQRPWRVPTQVAISKARARLGAEPMRVLYGEAVAPLADPNKDEAAFLAGLRLMAIDGTTLDLADTPANDAAFGRPGSGRGEGRAAYPQLRAVGIAECGTHAICDVALGPIKQSEGSLAASLWRSLRPGMLLLADRGFWAFQAWQAARATGAELLWRVRSNLILSVDEVLPDGSYHSRIYDSSDRQRAEPVAVRIVEYELTDPALGSERYRLATTITDPERASATELAACYPKRWEFETALDELKTHQRGPRLVLRSKTPDGVYQEVWGYLLVHYAIRALMHEVAIETGHQPDRLSFTRSLRVVRRTTRAGPGFSPHSA